MSEMEYRMLKLMEAALEGKPELAGDMTPDERQMYEEMAAQFEDDRKNGRHVVYDIPFDP